jgi:hypothetical protein
LPGLLKGHIQTAKEIVIRTVMRKEWHIVFNVTRNFLPSSHLICFCHCCCEWQFGP